MNLLMLMYSGNLPQGLKHIIIKSPTQVTKTSFVHWDLYREHLPYVSQDITTLLYYCPMHSCIKNILLLSSCLITNHLHHIFIWNATLILATVSSSVKMYGHSGTVHSIHVFYTYAVMKFTLAIFDEQYLKFYPKKIWFTTVSTMVLAFERQILPRWTHWLLYSPVFIFDQVTGNNQQSVLLWSWLSICGNMLLLMLHLMLAN